MARNPQPGTLKTYIRIDIKEESVQLPE